VRLFGRLFQQVQWAALGLVEGAHEVPAEHAEPDELKPTADGHERGE
jgi:hypothetical protein